MENDSVLTIFQIDYRDWRDIYFNGFGFHMKNGLRSNRGAKDETHESVFRKIDSVSNFFSQFLLQMKKIQIPEVKTNQVFELRWFCA